MLVPRAGTPSLAGCSPRSCCFRSVGQCGGWHAADRARHRLESCIAHTHVDRRQLRGGIAVTPGLPSTRFLQSNTPTPTGPFTMPSHSECAALSPRTVPPISFALPSITSKYCRAFRTSSEQRRDQVPVHYSTQVLISSEIYSIKSSPYLY